MCGTIDSSHIQFLFRSIDLVLIDIETHSFSYVLRQRIPPRSAAPRKCGRTFVYYRSCFHENRYSTYCVALIFRQIFDFAHCRGFVRFCVCLSFYLRVTIVRTGQTLTKIKNVNDVCKLRHLWSNGDIAKIAHGDLDLFIDVTKSKTLYVSEMVRANASMHWTSFGDFDICHRIASLRKLYFVNLTYFLKINKLKR